MFFVSKKVKIHNKLDKSKFIFGGACGFTVIELMVVVAIATLLMVTVFSSQRNYEDTILLKNSAYETALFIREAQAYATGVRLLAATGPDKGRYGVHVDIDAPKTLYLYKDSNNDGIYSPVEKVREMNLESVFFVKHFYTEKNDGSKDTYGAGDKLDILFVRPDPKPVFFVNSAVVGDDVSSVSVEIATPSDKTQQVTSFKVGHVFVE